MWRKVHSDIRDGFPDLMNMSTLNLTLHNNLCPHWSWRKLLLGVQLYKVFVPQFSICNDSDHNIWNDHWKQTLEEISDRQAGAFCLWMRINEVTLTCKHYNHIYIFGRHMIAKRILNWLHSSNISNQNYDPLYCIGHESFLGNLIYQLFRLR